jgi:hypothetical protein
MTHNEHEMRNSASSELDTVNGKLQAYKESLTWRRSNRIYHKPTHVCTIPGFGSC